MPYRCRLTLQNDLEESLRRGSKADSDAAELRTCLARATAKVGTSDGVLRHQTGKLRSVEESLRLKTEHVGRLLAASAKKQATLREELTALQVRCCIRGCVVLCSRTERCLRRRMHSILFSFKFTRIRGIVLLLIPQPELSWKLDFCLCILNTRENVPPGGK